MWRESVDPLDIFHPQLPPKTHERKRPQKNLPQVSEPLCQGCKFESPPKTGNYVPLLIGPLSGLGSCFSLVGLGGQLQVEG